MMISWVKFTLEIAYVNLFALGQDLQDLRRQELLTTPPACVFLKEVQLLKSTRCWTLSIT